MNQNEHMNEIQKLKYLKELKERLEAGIAKGQIGMTIGRDIQDISEA